MNLWILLAGWAMVLSQAVLSHYDGFLTRYQMWTRYGIERGYSFLQHGAMWADFFIVTPCVAYVLGRHAIDIRSFGTWFLLALSVGVVSMGNRAYIKAALDMPEHHTHDGEITPAGHMHNAFFVLGLWIITMFYITPLTPRVEPNELIAVSAALTPFFFMGVAKWDRRWFKRFPKDGYAVIQSIVGPIVVWAATLLRIYAIKA